MDKPRTNLRKTCSGDVIYNVIDSRGKYHDYPNAKEYWGKRTGKEFGSCIKYGCTNHACDGAHIYLNGGKSIYIAPLCTACNRSRHDGAMKVNVNKILAPIGKEYYA